MRDEDQADRLVAQGKSIDWSMVAPRDAKRLARVKELYLDGKVRKAKGMLYKFKQLVGMHWGPKPKYMCWLWMGMVHPMVMYVWCSSMV